MPIDLDLAARAQPWCQRDPTRLAHEVSEMAEHFPHWRLVRAAPDGAHLAACPDCGDLYIPTCGAWQCAACGQSATLTGGLAWTGHLPALWPDHPRLAALPAPPPGHTLIAAGGQRYLLVPLSIYYQNNGMQQEPLIHYAPQFLGFLGLTRGGATHMLDLQRPCLFYPGQWITSLTVRAILQQRLVNHLASLIKIALGQSPSQAFIGRIHDNEWNGSEPR